MKAKGVVALALSMLVCASIVPAQASAATTVPKVPKSSYVLDQTKTLSDNERTNLNKKITDYKAKTSVQLAVLVFPQLQNETIEQYGIRVARTWGIGEKEKNNGALLLIAKNDRKLRIEVGLGLEGDLTDARSSRIIRERITPEFRNGNYYAGINSGIDGMILAINAKEDPSISGQSQQKASYRFSDLFMSILIAIIIFGSWLASILGRSKRWWPGGVVGGVVGGGGALLGHASLLSMLTILAGAAGAGFLFDYVVSKNYRAAKSSGGSASWWAGGGSGFGSGSSSSGGGFGGGGFGGGGSSGSW